MLTIMMVDKPCIGLSRQVRHYRNLDPTGERLERFLADFGLISIRRTLPPEK
jgi:hypothetical protein